MANPFEVAPPNILQALMLGQQGFDRSQKAAKDAELRALRQEAGDLYASGGDMRGVLGRLLGLGDAESIKALGAMGPKENPEVAKLKALRENPELMQTAMALRQAGATKVNNAVSMGENEYQKQVGGDYGKLFGETQKAGRSALGIQGVLNRMEALVQDPSFYSGGSVAENLVLPYKQAIAALGGDPNSAKSMEEFRALSNKAALEGMGGSLGTGFSNADRDFITTQYPNLQNTAEGNKARIDGLRKIEQRKIEIAKMAREYAQRNGRIDANFEAALTDWAEKNPLFPQASKATSAPTQQPTREQIEQELRRRNLLR